MMDIVTFGISGILTLVVCIISIILLVLTIVFGIIRAVKKKFKKTFIILLIVTILLGIVNFFTINNLIKSFNEINIDNDESINIRQEDGKIIFSFEISISLFIPSSKFFTLFIISFEKILFIFS